MNSLKGFNQASKQTANKQTKTWKIKRNRKTQDIYIAINWLESFKGRVHMMHRVLSDDQQQ